MNFLWEWCMRLPLLSLFAEPLASFPASQQISKAQKTLEHSTFHSWGTKINQRHTALLFKPQSKQRQINGSIYNPPFHSSVCLFLSCFLFSFSFPLFSSFFVPCYGKHDSWHWAIQPLKVCFTSEKWLRARHPISGDRATCVWPVFPRDVVLVRKENRAVPGWVS